MTPYALAKSEPREFTPNARAQGITPVQPVAVSRICTIQAELSYSLFPWNDDGPYDLGEAVDFVDLHRDFVGVGDVQDANSGRLIPILTP